MNIKQRFGTASVLVMFLLTLFVQPSQAHGSTVAVPREGPTRPVPVVDGQCERGEYVNAYPVGAFIYDPVGSFTPVLAYIISNDSDLFLCMRNMPLRLGATRPYIEVVFDTHHDSGVNPDNDDLRFIIFEDGTSSSQRGTGRGWRDDATIRGWEMRMDFESAGFYWHVEARFPLSLLGGGEAGRVIGASIQHRSLRTEGDRFPWPRGSNSRLPFTWADLEFRSPSGTPGWFRTDQVRVTQGLDFDMNAGVAYDLIAGKDTLIRTQIYTLGDIPTVEFAECHIQRLDSTFPVDPVVVTAADSPRPVINPVSHGFFNGSPTFNCWAGGVAFSSPGRYRITLSVRFVGVATPVEIPLHTWTFKETGNLRVYLFPWEDPAAADWRPWGPGPWGADLTPAAIKTNTELVRITPLESTWLSMTASSARSSSIGLRYLIQPGVYICPGRGADAYCLSAYTFANDNFRRINAQLADIEARTGILRERLDVGSMLQAATSSGGGQCNPGWGPVAGSGFDAEPRGGAQFVVIQEMMHCLGMSSGLDVGQLDPASPNIGPDRAHSRNATINFPRGLNLVDMFERGELWGTPYSVLFGTFTDLTNISNSFYEGWDWNNLRNDYLNLEDRRYPSTSIAAFTSARSESSLFHFVGTLSSEDILEPIYSQVIDELPMETTTEDPASPYALVFLSSQKKVLKTFNFSVGTHTHDHGPEGHGIVLTTGLPEGTAGLVIKKNKQILYAETFSQAAPVITSVNAVNHGQGGIDVSWNASDADSPHLRYNVFFEPVQGELRYLIAAGLQGNTFFYDTALAPATEAGLVIVEATDGMKTDAKASAPFAIEAKPPVVGITTPANGAALVAGQRVTLSGIGFDYTAGDLSDQSLTWESSEQGGLGSGSQLDTILFAGTHTLTLTGTIPSGMQASASIAVTVLADSDNDGLPDEYESEYACLNIKADDSATDADGDMLFPLAERGYGTNPCETDTDRDGSGDGDEVQAGSQPKDSNSTPAEKTLFLASDEIDIGICTKTATAKILLTTLSRPNGWRASTDQDWLTVTSSGKGSGEIQVTASCTGLPEAEYTAQIFITSTDGQFELVTAYISVPAGSR